MKILKTLTIVIAVLALVVAGGVAFVLAKFDAGRVKQEIATAVERQTGRTLKIDGDLALGFWPDVAVKVGHATLSERGNPEEFARLDGARVAVAVLPLLSRQLVMKRVEIDGLKATVIKRKDGTLNIADLAGGKPEEAAKVGAGGTAPAVVGLSAIAIPVIRLSNAELIWRDAQSGQSSKLTVSLELTGIAGQGDTLKVDKFTLDTRVQADTLRLALKLATPIAVDLVKQTVALTRIEGQLDLAHPGLPMQTLVLPLSGTVQANLATQAATVDLATQFDATHLKAKLDVGRFAPLALGFDIDIDQVDLDKYLPPPTTGTAADSKTDPQIDLGALKGLDLNGALKVGQLKAAQLKASKLSLQLVARNGRLEVAPLAANLYEGTLTGTLSVDANGNRIAAKHKLTNVQINPLLKDLLDKDMLAGRGSVVLDVTGRGETVGALKKSLAGTAKLALADGAVKGFNIGQKLRDAKSLLAGRQDVTQAGDATQQTDFSELSASFRINNGVAHNDDLTAKSPLLRLAGAGDIDIGNSRLDYLAKASIVATATGQGGKERDSLKGITLPVRLTGPFDNPSWKLELGGMVEEAAKAKIEEKKEELKQQAGEQLKGKLKGLFGR